MKGLRLPISNIFAGKCRFGLRYFFEISYKGTNYHGWQVQSNAMSVQQVIEEKMRQLLNSDVEITGSGRTDTGVHALQQYFHADLNHENDMEDLRYHLNAVLPFDIVVKSVRKVKDNAHARFDALSRAYRYLIIHEKDPFRMNEAYIYHRPLDIDLLNKAASLLIGRHDFQSFSKVKTEVNNFECEVYYAKWQQEGDDACFSITANRFLRGMVRAVVGTLLMVNENKIEVGDIVHILHSKNRRKAGRSVPPEGLYLSEITYPDDIFEN